ncbi:MAG: permease [Bacillus sp. (in: firmicutes)]
MFHVIRNNLFSIIMVFVLSFFLLFLSFRSSFTFSMELPSSFLTLNTIFLSVLIEALPFVLIGVLIAGFIQIFVTEEHIQKWIPKNKFSAVVVSCLVGALFPACECGIVSIVRKLIGKGVPIYAAMGFMLTGPLINPIVAASTYMAFGNSFKIAGLRIGLGLLVALLIAFLVSCIYKGDQLKVSITNSLSSGRSVPSTFPKRLWNMLLHSIDEFFDMVKFLIIGAFLAALVQTYLPAKTLLAAGSGTISSLLVMMGLTYVLSLCSEADAFIGASFSNIFPIHSILGFLLLGPMMDLKNTLMMLGVFRSKFVFGMLALIVSTVFIVMLIAQIFI